MAFTVRGGMEKSRRVCDRRDSVQRGVWVMLIECQIAVGLAVGGATSVM